jgi:hypothetical protein
MPISPLAFMKIMETGTSWSVSKGIPKDAKLHGFTIDPTQNCLYLFLEHESFSMVDVYAQVVPILETEFFRE